LRRGAGGAGAGGDALTSFNQIKLQISSDTTVANPGVGVAVVTASTTTALLSKLSWSVTPVGGANPLTVNNAACTDIEQNDQRIFGQSVWKCVLTATAGNDVVGGTYRLAATAIDQLGKTSTSTATVVFSPAPSPMVVTVDPAFTVAPASTAPPRVPGIRWIPADAYAWTLTQNPGALPITLGSLSSPQTSFVAPRRPTALLSWCSIAP
jgi:hypothetical protein